VISTKFHVPKKLVELHEKHWSTENLMGSGPHLHNLTDVAKMASCGTCSQRLEHVERCLVAIMDRLEQVLGNAAGLHAIDMAEAEKQFQQAWQVMGDSPTRQQRMVAWLNEQLQADEMGL
jgi:hypothetical protein